MRKWLRIVGLVLLWVVWIASTLGCIVATTLPLWFRDVDQRTMFPYALGSGLACAVSSALLDAVLGEPF